MAKSISYYFKEAQENPEYLFANFLANGVCDDDYKTIIIKGMPYCSVYAFLYLNNSESSNDYISRFKDEILTEKRITPELDDKNKKIFKQLTTECPVIRDILFEKEKRILDNCEDVNAYNDYLDKYNGVCEEFDLYAKYQISELSKTRFQELNVVISVYNKSHLFDIEGLRNKCQTINGINVVWKDGISNEKKEIIKEIFENSQLIDDNRRVSQYITKKQWHILIHNYNLNLLQRLCVDLDEPDFVQYYHVLSFIELIKDLTCVNVTLPSIEIVDRLPIDEFEDVFIEGMEWCVGNEIGNRAMARYLNNNHIGQTHVLLPCDAFAYFRIII